MLSRTEVIANLNDIVSPIHERISGLRVGLQIQYIPSLPGDSAEIHKRISGASAQEIKAGFALFGPHRDKFRMERDGIEDEQLSQGQFRIALLALKLAMSEHMRMDRGYCPGLILDDLFSELDGSVCSNLVDYLQEVPNQVFITSAVREHGVQVPGARIMEIRDGQVLQ